MVGQERGATRNFRITGLGDLDAAFDALATVLRLCPMEAS